MGSIFFLFFLVILFTIALFFIILSAILLIIQNVRKHKGKTVKKRWFVILITILVMNSIVAILPVGYIVFLRHVNTRNISKIIYAESGKMLYWPLGEYESTTNWFEMNGTKFVQFREGFSDETFFLDTTNNKHGKPVANIRFNDVDDNFFNDAMIFLLTGNTRETLEVSTIFPLKNENNFEFYEVNGRAGSGIFCPESKLDSIRAYYANNANYDTQNILCEYSIYSNKKGSGERHDRPYMNIKNNITLDPKIFDELHQVLDANLGLNRIEIPQKYIELDKAAKSGTPIFGYDERELFAYSKDKMAYKHVNLVLLEGRVYIEQGSGYHYVDAYSISDEMNQYLIDHIFVDEFK